MPTPIDEAAKKAEEAVRKYRQAKAEIEERYPPAVVTSKKDEYKIHASEGYRSEIKKMEDALSKSDAKSDVKSAASYAISQLQECLEVTHFNICKGYPAAEEIKRISDYAKRAEAALEKFKPASVSTPPTDEQKKAQTFYEEQKAALDKLTNTTLKNDLETLQKSARAQANKMYRSIDDQSLSELQTVLERAQYLPKPHKSDPWKKEVMKAQEAIWEPVYEHEKENERNAALVIQAGDQLNELQKSKAKYYKSKTSPYQIAWEATGEPPNQKIRAYPTNIFDPENAAKQGKWGSDLTTAKNNFIAGWKRTIEFLAMKTGSTSFIMEIDTNVIKDEKKQREYLGYLLELQEYGEKIGLKMTIGDPNNPNDPTRDLIAKYSHNAPDGSPLKKLKGLVEKQMEAHKEKQAKREAHAPAPPDAKKLMLDSHKKALESEIKAIESKGSPVTEEAAAKERLKQLQESYRRLEYAGKELDNVVKNSLSDDEKKQSSELMDQMKGLQKSLAHELKQLCDAVDNIASATPDLKKQAHEAHNRVLAELLNNSGGHPTLASREKELSKATMNTQERVAYYAKELEVKDSKVEVKDSKAAAPVQASAADLDANWVELNSRFEKCVAGVKLVDEIKKAPAASPEPPELNELKENLEKQYTAIYENYQKMRSQVKDDKRQEFDDKVTACLNGLKADLKSIGKDVTDVKPFSAPAAGPANP